MSAYDCPDCEWDPADHGWSGESGPSFYYVEDGECIGCTKADKVKVQPPRRIPDTGKWEYDWKITANPPKGKKAYPVYGPQVYSHYAAMEFGCSNPVDWDETYMCPACNKEFTFSNGSY